MEASPQAVIRVVGVGGGGVNAVNRMIEADLRGVEFIAVNTDAQALLMSDADVKLEIGRDHTHGLGAGADPEVGKKAASDHEDEIREILEGSNMVFVTAGEGGGTGTGAAPIVAGVARELGALTVGVVTRPFEFEGRRRAEQAERGIEALREQVDALIVIPNERLLDSTNEDLSVIGAFRAADQVLQASVQGITEIITIPADLNVDFADVTTTLKDAKTALMGIGSATGPERAMDAVEMAISSPLLETSMEGANRVLLFFQGGSDLKMSEWRQASKLVQELADPEANIIVGVDINETFGDEVRVTVIATGFNGLDAAGKPIPTKTAASVPSASSLAASAVRSAGSVPKSFGSPAVAGTAPAGTTPIGTTTAATVAGASAAPVVPSVSNSAVASGTLNAPSTPAGTTHRQTTGSIADSVAARLAEHRAKEKPVAPTSPRLTAVTPPTNTAVPLDSQATGVPHQADPNAARIPAGTETIGKPKPSASTLHNPEVKITGLAGIPDAKREPLAVTSGIRPVSPDASTVPNYVDSSREQTAPPLRLQQVFDDITPKDELDIPDFLR